ncbi:MAG: RimK family protein [Gemmatimonadota bacterium]|nr:RimK family protein [Gemmatimonadota bacterium]MDH3427183.1 RimK family protein [Gemmatimonadota bacterium]
MVTLIVVENPSNWPFKIQDARVISARAYLTDPEWSTRRSVKLFNLCRSYRYQSTGYYVSLLAEARGHKPRPPVATIQDMKSDSLVRFVSDGLEGLIQKSLAPIKSDSFELSIYFGRNLAKRYDKLSHELSQLFEAPLLRATFRRERRGWRLRGIRPIPASEVPESHRGTVAAYAEAYFGNNSGRRRPRFASRYDVAMLVGPADEHPPSDERALRRFERAAKEMDLRLIRITKDDYGRISEFDGLFIRADTRVDDYTYRFARRAARDGLAVIDHPDTIVRCTNKVYLAELLERHSIPTPRTMIVHDNNVEHIATELGLPCVLKQPDSSFSLGVVRADTAEQLRTAVKALLSKSDLIVAQEFVLTDYDWRIGVLDGAPLYACRYYMADKHWQILNWEAKERERYGRVETLAVDAAPREVVRLAVEASALMGPGLYGVDLKDLAAGPRVIEINDNPSIDAGIEDAEQGMDLYRRIMGALLERIEARTRGSLAT